MCKLSGGQKEADAPLSDSLIGDVVYDNVQTSSSDIPVYEYQIGEDKSSSQTFSSGISASPLLTPQEQITHTLTISSGSSSRAFAGDRFVSHSLSLPHKCATSEGCITQCSSLPSGPPPLIPCATSATNNSPFTLAFIAGNIRVCRGCRQKFIKPPVPPNDLCVHHQEWQEFTPAGASFPQ